MSNIQNYPSQLDDPQSRRLETFSYLTPMDAKAVRSQVEYMLSRGWTCAIEHVEPERASQTYWYLWKLPLFDLTEVDAVMGELGACRTAYPDHHVRLTGYDRKRQTQGLGFVVHRGAA
ncbi:MAG: ribulose bisphosphate carboxylase small subunit [Kiloniellales bacterium]|nr:ribulose bisphosphate carboxylase small subunit [Kiloniellales bacterium]